MILARPAPNTPPARYQGRGRRRFNGAVKTHNKKPQPFEDLGWFSREERHVEEEEVVVEGQEEEGTDWGGRSELP